MPKLFKLTLQDVLSSFPNLNKVTSFNNFKRNDELFLCALGFEERCLAIPTDLSKNGYKSNNCLYFEYDTNIEANSANKKPLVDLLKSFSKNVLPLKANSKFLHKEIKDFLNRQTRNSSNKKSITIDISVFSVPLLATVIPIAFAYNFDLNIVYSEAAQYYPDLKTYDKNKAKLLMSDDSLLEEGVGHIAASPEHPGIHTENIPNHVFHFPSFNKMRGKSLLQYVAECFTNECNNPNITYFLGDPPAKHNKWRLNAIKEINGISTKDKTRIVSTLHYKETLMSLEEEYQGLWKHKNINISTLGSKMQTLAILLFCIMHPEIKILVSRPKEYKSGEYSQGHSNFWHLQFEDTTKYKELLRSVGTLKFHTK